MRVSEFFEPRRVDLEPINSRAVAGGNNPPGPLEASEITIRALSDFMKDHPVIQSEEDARAAKPFLDRGRLAMDEIEADRDNKVRPLNQQVAEINAEYKAIHNTDPKKPGRLNKIYNELKERVSKFLREEEQRRLREAAAARAAAEEAERQAREKEAKEREALENASVGEAGVDVAAVTQEADESFATFQRASRFAERAEKDTHVKLGGGFAQSVSLRTAETLTLDDPLKALVVIGVTDKIRDAILSAARDYRKLNGKLPDGVTSTKERKL